MSASGTSIPLSLVLLVCTLVLAVVTIGYVALAAANRSTVIDRATATHEAGSLMEGLLVDERPSMGTRLSEWIASRMPGSAKTDDHTIAERLMLAGFDAPAAQAMFNASRAACAVLVPFLAWTVAPKDGGTLPLIFGGGALMIAVVGPTAVLDRLIERRRHRIRRGVPDALDLLVVCVEAGVSLDAAMLRVSRDLASMHPELCFELGQVVRKVSAGIPRDRALQELPKRTGVEELRTLVASMIQSERLGSSIARVLRINAETLRLRRKQMVEKNAAEAALKMLLPMALFLLPALLIVIIGPAIIEMLTQFGGGAA